MTEQTATNRVVSQAAEGHPSAVEGNYTWENVQRDKKDWHPALQRVAERLLTDQGFAADAVASPDLTPTTAPDTTKVAAAKVEQTADPEKRKIGVETIADAFATGQKTLYKLTADPAFHKRCKASQVDPYDDIDSSKYWNVVSRYAQERVAFARERQGDTIHARAFELMAMTPQYLFAQQALDRKGHALTSAGARDADAASRFNAQIRALAIDFPELRSTKLAASLLGVANIAMENKEARASALDQIGNTIRGAQHELAFGQLLAAAGYDYTAATEKQDRGGRDYEVVSHRGRPMGIDVKASLYKIRNAGSKEDYALRSDGTVVMHSFVRDEDFNGKFFVPPEVIQNRIGRFTEQMEQVEARVG